jgi:hypothetical protein
VDAADLVKVDEMPWTAGSQGRRIASDAAKYPATEAVVRQKLAPTWEGTVLQSDGV